jgi:hypothetical protein
MADTNELFNTLEDGSGNGVAIRQKAEGDAPSTDNGLMGFSFKDSSGNLVLPQLNASGQLPVTPGAAGTPISGSAVATPVSLNTDTDVVVIALTASETYECSMAMGSSFQPVEWNLVHNDNGTPNELARFVTGPGSFAHNVDFKNIAFTAGAAGTQELKLIGSQKRGGLSDMHGTVSVLET